MINHGRPETVPPLPFGKPKTSSRLLTGPRKTGWTQQVPGHPGNSWSKVLPVRPITSWTNQQPGRPVTSWNRPPPGRAGTSWGDTRQMRNIHTAPVGYGRRREEPKEPTTVVAFGKTFRPRPAKKKLRLRRIAITYSPSSDSSGLSFIDDLDQQPENPRLSTTMSDQAKYATLQCYEELISDSLAKNHSCDQLARPTTPEACRVYKAKNPRIVTRRQSVRDGSRSIFGLDDYRRTVPIDPGDAIAKSIIQSLALPQPPTTKQLLSPPAPVKEPRAASVPPNEKSKMLPVPPLSEKPEEKSGKLSVKAATEETTETQPQDGTSARDDESEGSDASHDVKSFISNETAKKERMNAYYEELFQDDYWKTGHLDPTSRDACTLPATVDKNRITELFNKPRFDRRLPSEFHRLFWKEELFARHEDNFWIDWKDVDDGAKSEDEKPAAPPPIVEDEDLTVTYRVETGMDILDEIKARRGQVCTSSRHTLKPIRPMRHFQEWRDTWRKDFETGPEYVVHG